VGDDPARTVLAAPLSIEPTVWIAARVWWSWFWRTMLSYIVLTWFISAGLVILCGTFGLGNRALRIATQASHLTVLAVVGLYFFTDILDKEFRGFRVCVMPNNKFDDGSVRGFLGKADVLQRPQNHPQDASLSGGSQSLK
jgi:hypothetical protein